MNIKLFGIAELTALLTVSKPTIYRRIKDGSFPSPVRISARRVAWRECDIAAWLDLQAGVAA